MNPTPTLQQLAEAAARECVDLIHSQHGFNCHEDDKLAAIILKHLAPLEAQLVEASFSAEHRKHLLEGAIFHREKAEQERDEARREVERLTKYNKAIINFDLTTENQQLKEQVEALEIRHTATMMHTQSIVDDNQQLKARCDGLEIAMNAICQCVSAQEGGGFYQEHFNGDGNYIGSSPVDPISVVQAMHSIAVDNTTSLTHYQELERKAKAFDYLDTIKTVISGNCDISSEYRYSISIFTGKDYYKGGENLPLLTAIETAMKGQQK